MRKVALATANRAERGFLTPLIDRLTEKAKKGEIRFQLVEPRSEWPDHWQPYFANWLTNSTKPDVILIPADRKEMLELAKKCYFAEIPIFHLYAGIGSTGTYDDMIRRIISSFSYLMLCESSEAKERLIKSGEEAWRCVEVGSVHGDDLKIDESEVPHENYDLVLVNPNPADPKDTALTLKNALDELDPSRLTLWIEPNEVISTQMDVWLTNIIKGRKNVRYLKTLERPKFLGLMKHCRRYISNSSSLAYEWGIIGARGKVINPGNRNAHRNAPKVATTTPASDIVAELLATYPLDRAKLLKIYR